MPPPDRLVDDCGASETRAAENMDASHHTSVPEAAPFPAVAPTMISGLDDSDRGALERLLRCTRGTLG